MTVQNTSLPALLIYARPRGRVGDNNIFDANTHKIIGEINKVTSNCFQTVWRGEFAGMYSDYIKAFLSLKDKARKEQC